MDPPLLCVSKYNPLVFADFVDYQEDIEIVLLEYMDGELDFHEETFALYGSGGFQETQE